MSVARDNFWGSADVYQNLLEDQCIFIRGFRVVRRLGILPRQLRGAAGPNPSLDRDHDHDKQHMELVSIPSATTVRRSNCHFPASIHSSKYRDPLHVLLEYITNVSSEDLDWRVFTVCISPWS